MKDMTKDELLELVKRMHAREQAAHRQLEAVARSVVLVLKDKQMPATANEIERSLFDLDANREEFGKAIRDAGPSAALAVIGLLRDASAAG